MSGQYKSFDEITSDALRATFTQLEIPFGQADIDSAMNAYQNCELYPDAARLLETLKLPWAVVTNGNREWIGPMLLRAGVTVRDDNLLTSDQVKDFKVSPAMYELGWQWAQRVNSSVSSKSEVLFISANQWDALGATWFGFAACWVNRSNSSPEFLDVRPQFELHSLDQIASLKIVTA